MHNPFDPGYYCSEELRGFGFAHVGENVRISKDCAIFGIDKIYLGDDVRIDSKTDIVVTGGKLTFAGRNHIGGKSHLCVAADLSFSEFSGTSQLVSIYTATDNYFGGYLNGPMVPAKYRRTKIAPVILEEQVMIGAQCVILPGVVCRQGSAVGALSLVDKSLDEWTLYAGTPARAVIARKRHGLRMAAELRVEAESVSHAA